jgi:hypothetical protein
LNIRQAPYALRVVRRRAGDAAILYRRRLTERHEERLDRVAAIGPLAYSAGTRLMREGARAANRSGVRLEPGPFLSLDPDWGARIACYALVARGLRNAARLNKAAEHLREADAAEAAWWFGMMTNGSRQRAVRALRILLEAVR